MAHLLRLTAGLSSVQDIPSSVKRNPNTVLVIWGARHGNRNPEQFLEEKRTWGAEGAMELTEWGRRQAHGLGLELRRFIGNLGQSPSGVRYFSSSARRCRMTLQTSLAALHNFPHAVPFTVDDQLLRAYCLPEGDCPNVGKVWDVINRDETPVLAAIRQEKAQLISYLAEKTGWTFGHLGIVADVADNLIQMDLYGADYPVWIREPSLEGYDAKRLRREVLQFAEIHQYACAEYGPCRRLMAGLWVADILKSIEDALKGRGPVVVGYCSHTEVTMSVMRQLGIVKDELTTSAGFILELRLKPTPSIRLLCHDPYDIDKHIISKADYVSRLARVAEADGFIPLQIFVDHVKPNVISDWDKACTSAYCTTSYK